ncbi:TetR/AcrR family transcriptional regulator [Streptomyces pinistramenti]|uniref:TetR/AcrR family transcriptional regulator n=1 Tax=Streptomyces pinistramenti TaxID=2884812 RepID=UPI001D084C39|nr:TetR family transcriptional regulator C-terminal domain-containing protein [Streptomyces pinistramenti]MCB5907390.1 TetR family transcriptional regulator C-terminal domain-containing protein [Streptomyces pinistramenti]
MSPAAQRKRIRKSPADRRAEIVDAAAAVALTEGLECITLRRIGERLAVRPGLIGHYFPAAEDLVAEAFGSAASAELDTLLPTERPEGTLTRHLARLLAHATGEAYDNISRLWINARHLSRYRPALRERVGEQEAAWRGRLTDLIREGAERGEFHPDDPHVTAIQILVVLDGLGAHANTDTSNRPLAVTRMAVTTAERELGLPAGALAHPADTSDDTRGGSRDDDHDATPDGTPPPPDANGRPTAGPLADPV